MSKIEYLYFDQVNPDNFIEIVNEDSVRKHLIDHPYFDKASLLVWIEEKKRIDATRGCRIRAVYVDGLLAGWCGVQPDDYGFELAIVISKRFWGFGLPIFKTLMSWASELGHNEVLFHLLETRREYKALAKVATKVHRSQLLGRSFNTYYFSVSQQRG